MTNYKVKQLEEERKWREIGLRRALNQEDIERVLEVSRDNAELVFKMTRERQRVKFEKLSTTYTQETRTETTEASKKEKWVLNLSKHKLTNAERSVLEKGMNFAPTYKSIPRTEIIAGVEAALRSSKNTSEEKAERTRGAIAAVIRSSKQPKQNITQEEREALKTLRQNNEIIILPADKGNSTVVLSTEDYERKASFLLNSTPFVRIGKDPTDRTVKRVNDTLKRVAKKEDAEISKQLLALRVSNGGTRPPLFYGAVKVHKPDHPLRPIVSSIGSATYEVSKYVSNTLSTYSKQLPSYVQNTAHFIEDIQGIKIADDEAMVSYDVKSLFTSIPREDALKAVRETLEADENFTKRTGISVGAVLQLTRLCMITNFQFRGCHYELSDGLAMGAPSSPVIANIYMGKLEEKALATFETRPKFWRRYVDDVFAIVKKKMLEKFLHHLNGQHPSIRFTVEMETERQLPFLDARVHRIGTRLASDVYRKPTHTGRYLNFTSNHPDSAKRSVVRALAHRQHYVTRGEQEVKRELERVNQELEINGYPKEFIKKCSRPQLRSTQKHEWQTTASLPYVRGISEAIGRILKPLGIRTVTRKQTLKWDLMKGAKDSLPPEKEPGVIYAIGCQVCPKVYVGETVRTSETRVKEHKAHVKHGRMEQSAVANHVINEDHAMHWKPRVVGKEKNTTKRKVKEALLIKKLKNGKGVINQDNGLMLSPLFLDLVQ